MKIITFNENIFSEIWKNNKKLLYFLIYSAKIETYFKKRWGRKVTEGYD